MEVGGVLAELVRRARQYGRDWQVSPDDMDAWVAATGLTQAALVSAVALDLARAYDDRELNFRVADDIANTLDAFVGFDDRPEIFDRVYGAFDAGEFHRKADKSDDPESAFTRPLIRRLLAEVDPTPEGTGRDRIARLEDLLSVIVAVSVVPVVVAILVLAWGTKTRALYPLLLSGGWIAALFPTSALVAAREWRDGERSSAAASGVLLMLAVGLLTVTLILDLAFPHHG